MVVVDKHTIDLMRRYGYLLHRRGDVIMSVEIDCNEKDLRKHMKTLTSIAPETKETKETKETFWFLSRGFLWPIRSRAPRDSKET